MITVDLRCLWAMYLVRLLLLFLGWVYVALGGFGGGLFEYGLWGFAGGFGYTWVGV